MKTVAEAALQTGPFGRGRSKTKWEQIVPVKQINNYLNLSFIMSQTSLQGYVAQAASKQFPDNS